MVRVLIAGGSGFLGQKLAVRLRALGHRVQVLTRRSSSSPDVITWTPDGTPSDLRPHFEGADGVVNLAGSTIGRWPWTASRKEAIRTSRVVPTRTLARTLSLCAQPPKVFVSASGVGYYGAHGDEPVTEATPPGSDFLARVCVEWEEEARAAQSSATRVCIVRTAPAFSRDGGLFPMMLLPFKLGVAGRLGSGRQYMPWIHVDDWTALVTWLLGTERATGAFNVTAPEPVTNREFTRILGRVLRRPTVLPVPAFALRLALGEMADLVLHGQRALPARSEQLGFRFSYRALEPALHSLLT
jgi:uncharacterized protein (TIGR01777 family)